MIKAQQRMANALAVEAALLETRRKNNAWYRLEQGMQLTPVTSICRGLQLELNIWFQRFGV